ncbi:MAG TPA: hypothetical protein DCL24_08995 [Erysipelotrichaceae bacterium]|nr:hypothetical protein [Erysipelotrichaceae bacterium]
MRNGGEPFMKCPNCGNEFNESIGFCPYCGYQVPQQSQQPSQYQTKYIPEGDEQPQNGNKKNTGIIIGIVAAVVVAAVGVYFFFLRLKYTTLITLDDFTPAYTADSNGNINLDLDECSYSFISNTDEGNQYIGNDKITIKDFKFSKKKKLKNGEKITVSIDSTDGEVKITGSKTFTAKFDKDELVSDTTNNESSSSKEKKDESKSTTQTADDITARMKASNGQIFPNSSTAVLTDAELAQIKTPSQLRIAINEIYARNHYTFTKNASVKSYFESKSWYTADSSRKDDTDMNSIFNSVEKQNLEKLQAMRTGALAYGQDDVLQY